jgi:hypothetical protein
VGISQTFALLQREPYAGMFEPVPPRVPIPLEEAAPFDCRRSARRDPRETKGPGDPATRTMRSACGGTDGPCC